MSKFIKVTHFHGGGVNLLNVDYIVSVYEDNNVNGTTAIVTVAHDVGRHQCMLVKETVDEVGKMIGYKEDL